MLAFYLHTVFQNQHILPGVALGMRGPMDKLLPREHCFIMASTKKALEEGDTPVKIRNFAKEKKEGQ